MLEHVLVLRGQDEITLFAPGVDARYLLGVAQQSQAVVNVRIEWEDESGPDRVWESQLKVL
jgi:hypothetical protein